MVNRNIIRYYDANTSRFLTFGHGRKNASIHRALWGEGVASREEAVNYVHTVIARCIHAAGAEEVLDIGCGVGGSMIALAALCGARFTGITISPVQHECGIRLLGRSGWAERCTIIPGDLTDPSALGGSFDCAYAIESFLHMPGPEIFFRRAAELVRAGGELIIFDDFLSPGRLSAKDEALIGRFRSGWQVGSLEDPESVRQYALQNGFSMLEERDLSPLLELGRPRDRLIRLLLPLLRPFFGNTPFVQNMEGGDALQQLLAAGTLTHRFLRFRRIPPSGNREETARGKGGSPAPAE